MITLPPYHVPTKYEGYYWNLQDKCLYSSKMGHELRPMRFRTPHRFNKISTPGYTVSVNGKRKFLPIGYLWALNIFNIIDNPVKCKRKRK